MNSPTQTPIIAAFVIGIKCINENNPATIVAPANVTIKYARPLESLYLIKIYNVVVNNDAAAAITTL